MNMKNILKGIISLLSMVVVSNVESSNCPIIFIHGHKSEATLSAGWSTWYCPSEHVTAMTTIVGENYKQYQYGIKADMSAAVSCDKNTDLLSTPYDTKKVYNFSFYSSDGSSGVIGDPLIIDCQWGYDC